MFLFAGNPRAGIGLEIEKNGSTSTAFVTALIIFFICMSCEVAKRKIGKHKRASQKAQKNVTVS